MVTNPGEDDDTFLFDLFHAWRVSSRIYPQSIPSGQYNARQLRVSDKFMASKVLIATTCHWFSAARLAMAFDKAGCTVDVVCPSGHPVVSTHAIDKRYLYHGLAPLHSFRTAILSSKPDIVIPSDDLAMRHLHRLYAAACQSEGDASRTLCEVLQFSLGDPASYPITESRDKFMAMVYEEGILTPETKTIASTDEVEDWLSQYGFPAVLKADGTSGGEGVKIVYTLAEALRAYETLHAPLATIVVTKRTVLDRDWNCVMPWLKQHRRAVSIQSFVPGPDANIAVACWRGEVLAAISVEVLQTWKPKGPATIVRLLENGEMLEAARKVLRRLKFSGLCGFDFMIHKSTGVAQLIEMNARATQTAALPLGHDRDLIASLCSVLSGQHHSTAPIELPGDTIALFPLAWKKDTSSELFLSSYHDIPREEPELVRLGMAQPRNSSKDGWIRLFSKLGLHRP